MSIFLHSILKSSFRYIPYLAMYNIPVRAAFAFPIPFDIIVKMSN